MAFLSNLSVKAADNSNSTLLMPKLQFRFRLNFFNFGSIGDGTAQMTRQVIDCSRPNLSFQKITIPVYNSTIYMAGKHTWNTMSINLRDDSSGLVSRIVGSQLQKQLDFAEQASAASAQDYKFRLTLDMLDGGNGAIEPVALETWDLEGCYLESVNYNTVNYGTSEVVTLALTVQYDNAVQTVGGAVGVQGINGPRNPVGTSTSDGPTS